MTQSFAIYSHGWSIRFRPLLAPQPIAMNDNLRFQSVALSSLGNGWRATIEQTQPALVARAISQGLRLICNLRGGFKALRSLSFRSRVKLCQEAARGIFNTLSLSPVPVLSMRAAHDEQHDRRIRQSVVKE